MILSAVKMKAGPKIEGDLLQIINSILEPSRVETGCLGYHLYREMNAEGSFLLLSKWETRAHLEKHLATNNFGRLIQAVELLSSAPEIEFHTVTTTDGLDLLQEVREKKG